MIIEINGKKFDYDERNLWGNRIGELSGKALNLVAYQDKPEIFFQIFKESSGYNLQKRAEDYTLEYGLDEIHQSQIVELIDLYFGNSNKFDSYFQWERTNDGLTKEEKIEYKKSSWKNRELVKWISIIGFIGSFYLFKKLIDWKLEDSNYRIFSAIGFFVSSYGVLKYWRWERLNDKKYKDFSPYTLKALLLAILGIFFGIIVLIAPYIHNK